jgi:sugar lactone lactonase YvrE
MKSTTKSRSLGSAWIAPLLVGALLSAQVTIARAGTTASRELGQPDFVHNSPNTVDPQALSLNTTDRVGVAVDTSASPNHLYITDPGNNRVLGYSSVAALVNGGPATLVIGQPDLFSSAVGFTASSLNGPRGVAVDTSGNVYVADTANNRVLVFSNPFTIFGVSGQNSGFVASAVIGQGGDFTANSCNLGASAPNADTLCAPESVALDGSNNLYVADTSNNRVLEYSGPVSSSTFAANLVFGQFGSFITSIANNSGTSKDSLNFPGGVAIDKNNNLYVADSSNNRVLEYNTPLTVTGIAGSGDTSADQVWGQGGSFGTMTCNSGGASATTLCAPSKVALDAAANLYIDDTSSHRVLEYNEAANPPTNRTANLAIGQVDTSSASCNQGGGLTPSPSTLCFPSGTALDSAGELFVADTNNNRVLKYNTPLSTDEIASVVLGQSDLTHSATNLIDAASLNGPKQIAIDASASPNRIFVADTANNRVLGYRNAAAFVNNAPADLVIGEPDFRSNGGGATSSRFSSPQGVAVDSNGNLYVADTSNSRVLEFTAPFAGCSGTFPCVGGAANKVFGQSNFTASTCNIDNTMINANSLCFPRRVAVDLLGNLYVGDSSNNRVLEYDTPLSTTSVTGSGDTTADLVFGQGVTGKGTEFTTNDVNHPSNTVSTNSLFAPTGVTVDSNNNLYVADFSNSRVLEYNETVNATTPPGNVTASAVFGQLGAFSSKICNNVTESADSLCTPADVSTDASNNVYISDSGNNRDLQYLTPLVSGTTASVVWGQGGDFATGFANLAGIGPAASTLSNPNGVANDSASNFYIADTNNNRVLAYSSPFPPPGLVVAPPPSAGILSVPAQVRFKPTKLGRRDRRSIVVKNTGPVPVHIMSIDGDREFNYVSSCGSIIASGQSCTIQVTFAPITIGHRGGTLVISDDARSSPHIVDLLGRADRRRAGQ